MNETIAKAVIGNMLRRTRTNSGHTMREIATELGLPNPNYLSMIEKGTNFIPLKRLWDFQDAYRITRTQGLAAAKLSSPDLWNTIIVGLKVCGVSDAKIEKLNKDVELVIEEECTAAGIERVKAD